MIPARAAQLPRLPYIILSLIGLVGYDVVSVVGTQQFSDNGASIMEAVARAKAGMESLPLPSTALPNAQTVSDAMDVMSSTVLSSSSISSLPIVPVPSAPATSSISPSVLIPSLSSWRPGK